MKNLKKIKEIVEKHRDELKEKYNVKEIGIFGSYAREEAEKRSDLDVLVELKEPISLLGLVRIENHLSEILGIKVDLIPKKDIRPELRKVILKEAIYL